MNKIVLFLVIINCIIPCKAQDTQQNPVIINDTTFVNLKDYSSDFILDMKLGQTRDNLGIYYRYKIRPRIFVSGTFNQGIIRGADTLSLNPGRNGRRLDFKNNKTSQFY